MLDFMGAQQIVVLIAAIFEWFWMGFSVGTKSWASCAMCFLLAMVWTGREKPDWWEV